jgi:hypothetical protein
MADAFNDYYSIYDDIGGQELTDYDDSNPYGYYSDPFDYYSIYDDIGGQAFTDYETSTGDEEFMDFMTKAYLADQENQSSGVMDFIKSVGQTLGGGAKDFLKKYLYNPTTKQFNVAGLGTAGAALYSLMADNNGGAQGGYNKPVPKMEAVRQQVQYNDENRVPGSAGRQYFTDTQYVPRGDAAAKEAAVASAQEQASGLRALQPDAAPQVNPYAGKMPLSYANPAPKPQEEVQMAQGGIARLAEGGRYLAGATDGMADEIPSNIDGEQPAALSHGEFVIPADVVSHLGNGNSEAGAEKLYEMMSRIRKARTGTEEQGKEIEPNQFMPGGIVGLANGGAVQNFANGGDVAATTTTTQATSGGIPQDISKASTLSPWVGDYVTGALGQAGALANQPYQAYGGQLTAGPSDLQNQAFAGAGEVAQAGYGPSTYSSDTFNASAAQKYMNPYLQASLNPQIEEARRQSEISNLANRTAATKSGAFGGGRSALMESENQRNLLSNLAGITGRGYDTAYGQAMGQFNTEQDRSLGAEKASEASRQFGANFGLQSLDKLSGLGEAQRNIEQQGLAADKAQFEEQRDYAYKMPQYQLNLLQGLPIGANTTAVNQDAMSKLQGNVAGLGALYESLSKLGVTTPSS